MRKHVHPEGRASARLATNRSASRNVALRNTRDRCCASQSRKNPALKKLSRERCGTIGFFPKRAAHSEQIVAGNKCRHASSFLRIDWHSNDRRCERVVTESESLLAQLARKEPGIYRCSLTTSKRNGRQDCEPFQKTVAVESAPPQCRLLVRPFSIIFPNRCILCCRSGG